MTGERVAEAEVVELTSSPGFVAGYAAGIEQGIVIGQRIVDDERQAEVERAARDERRVGAALRRSPSYLELVARRYPDDGAAATALRERAAEHSARVWAGWPDGGAA